MSCNSYSDINNNSNLNNNVDTSSKDNSDKSHENLSTDFSKFNGFDIPQDEVTLKVDGKTFNFSLPIYINKNRYYFPLNELIHNLNGEGKKTVDSSKTLLDININSLNYFINVFDNTVKCPNKDFTLKEKLLNQDDIYYIGFSDFSNMLDLYTRWDKDNKIINCKMSGDSMLNNVAIYTSKNVQIGLIRFEDVCASSQSYDKNYFENLRIIGMYMNEKKIPYHIAWIPRYINPKLNIDNDPLLKNTFELSEMVYTLDYLKTHNGLIGLHGYTHQFGNNESGIGFEFGRYEPSVDIFRDKIKKAIETSNYLDIPIDFFEVPHYEITPDQNKIAEEYFKILYYPFNDYGVDKAVLTEPQLSPYNNSSYYISTPLDYIEEGKEEKSLTRIKNVNTINMGSVFYHPRLENAFISLSEDSKGIPTFNYDENSTLKKLINILEEKGYNIIEVTDIK